jgi:stearoyl-CoA desaturase (Delta-9 desaturase)
LVALFTWGEGYHNFHHRFPFDYRNGHRWFQWDPTKWMIYGFSKLGWTSELKMTPASEVYRARIQAQQSALKGSNPRLEALNESIESAHRRWHKLVMEVEGLKQNWDVRFTEKMSELRQKRQDARRDFILAYREWKLAVENLKKMELSSSQPTL